MLTPSTAYAAVVDAVGAATLNGVSSHLVTITSAAENAFVTGLLLNSWISGNDIDTEGTYKYSGWPQSGSTLGFSAWSPGQPDNFNNEDCAVLSETSPLPNNWNDLACSALRPYVIEYECAGLSVLTASGCQGQSMLTFMRL